jgi:hypothetical protein
MRKIYTLFGLGFFTLLSLSEAFGQTTIEGEFRPRTEFREGFRKPLADTLKPAFTTFQRTRLGVNYKSGILNSQITMQDSRIWGQTDSKSSTTLGIYEAWAELLFLPGFSTTIGRQALKYDDQRIFGTSNWTNAGQAHDLALLKFKTAKLQAHLGLAYNNNKDTLLLINYTIKQYKNMEFLWIGYNFNKGISASVLAINEGLQKSTDYSNTFYRNTVGANIVFANDSCPFSATLGGYYQFGKSNAYDTAKLAKNITFATLDAFMINAKVSYKLFDPLQVFAGADIYSGTSHTSANSKSFTFNKLYGGNHAFNGYMEYWTSLPKFGLKDYYVGITLKPMNNLSIELVQHFFSMYSNFQYTNNKKEKSVLSHDLGQETDLTVSYKLSKETSIQAGYSVYFKNSNIKKVLKTYGAEENTPQWAYIMLTIRPQFYKTPEVKLN